jgi:hypothetical protein
MSMASLTHPAISNDSQKLDLELLEIASTPIIHAIPPSLLAHALQTQPFIPIPGAQNMRDLGLIPHAKLKPGLIFRSGHLHNLPTSSIPLLSTHLKIHTLFDFRKVAERERHPDPELPSVRIVCVPCSEPWKQTVPKNFKMNGGVDGYVLFYDEFLRIYKSAYKIVLEHLRDWPGDSVLFHCSCITSPPNLPM